MEWKKAKWLIIAMLLAVNIVLGVNIAYRYTRALSAELDSLRAAAEIAPESYGFEVIDLGRDVAPDIVLDAVCRNNCKLVGLSALMTTTVPSMEKTIELLHSKFSDVKVVVGGAVLTQDYADSINADFYAKDAMDTVRFAEEFYKK